MSSLPPLPVTVIGGYLGAGKTTLVNHLLREARGRRIAVLVNDFGELPIDADLIEQISGSVIGIAGGCVCCSYGNDLIAALEELAQTTPRPDHVLLETSGVALPGAVAAAVTLLADYALDGVLVLADAETLRQRAADPYMADTVLTQLRQADLIALNKIDLVDSRTLADLRAWLSLVTPGAPVLEISEGRLPPALAFGLDGAVRMANSALPEFGVASHDHPHTAPFTTASLEIGHAVDAAALARGLSMLGPELLRAKGIVHDASGAALQLQVVGKRWRVGPAVRPLMGPGRLVAIGRAGEAFTTAIEALLIRNRV